MPLPRKSLTLAALAFCSMAAVVLAPLGTISAQPVPPVMPPSQPLAQLSGDQFDQVFLMTLIAQHAATVRLSQPLAAATVHPELVSFANALADEQTREIGQFRGWLKSWYGIDVSDPLSGTISFVSISTTSASATSAMMGAAPAAGTASVPAAPAGAPPAPTGAFAAPQSAGTATGTANPALPPAGAPGAAGPRPANAVGFVCGPGAGTVVFPAGVGAQGSLPAPPAGAGAAGTFTSVPPPGAGGQGITPGNPPPGFPGGAGAGAPGCPPPNGQAGLSPTGSNQTIAVPAPASSAGSSTTGTQALTVLAAPTGSAPAGSGTAAAPGTPPPPSPGTLLLLPPAGGGLELADNLVKLPPSRLEAVAMSLLAIEGQSTLDTAALAPDRANRQEIKDLAQRTLAGTASRNQSLNDWLAAWFGL